MKKEGRGSYDERVSVNGDVALVRWQDNGVVNMASTHLGVGNVGAVRRWSEASKAHVDIECPERRRCASVRDLVDLRSVGDSDEPPVDSVCLVASETLVLCGFEQWSATAASHVPCAGSEPSAGGPTLLGGSKSSRPLS
ncbi:hypothetical protein MRX96_020450 [Rhipicephalus microplus]